MNRTRRFATIICLLVLSSSSQGASLTGDFTSIPRNSVINLSEVGTVDWVHWGLRTATSLNRKSGVTPRIGNFSAVTDSANSNAFAVAYQFADNYNGYSWIDGTPEPRVTNTTTGVWCYGIPAIGTGFEFFVPADTTPRTLKVYVGAFAARGHFEAALSDGSAPTYVDSSLVNQTGTGNGPSGTYTVNYSAGSAGQTLRIRWTVQLGFRASANVTLQAAAMSVAGANNPPSVTLTAPGDSSTYAGPATINFGATAFDFDGQITRVEFFADDQRLGEDTTDPYSFAWNNAQPGVYALKALAYDDDGDVSESKPVEIFVHGSGGTLTGTVSTPDSTVNLTAEGTADWAHWGLVTNTSYNHKAGVSQQIGNFTKIGTNEVQRYADNLSGYRWSDGTPTASVPTNSHTGVFVSGEESGFALALPADTTVRTAKVYVGLYGAVGEFQAWLGDFSAQAYVDTSLDNIFDSSYAVYTLTYAAASAGKTLHIRYRPRLLYDGEFGNVTLQAVTLLGSGGANLPPSVSITNPPNNATFTAPANITIQVDASDSDGTITKVEIFNGSNKIDESTSSPYSFNWIGVGAGIYTLTARAIDDDGASATSSPVSITITGNTNTPPTVSLTNPTNNSVFTAPADIMLQADAADGDGTIAKVEFYSGANKLGEDTSSPYSFNWSAVAAGTYTITARAIDDDNAETTSSPVTMAVRNPLSPVTLENVTVTTGNFTFSFHTESNWTYTVEFVNVLGSGAWQTLRTVQGGGASVAVEDTTAGSSARWYRVSAR
jgi:hypothetical protein